MIDRNWIEKTPDAMYIEGENARVWVTRALRCWLVEAERFEWQRSFATDAEFLEKIEEEVGIEQYLDDAMHLAEVWLHKYEGGRDPIDEIIEEEEQLAFDYEE